MTSEVAQEAGVAVSTLPVDERVTFKLVFQAGERQGQMRDFVQRVVSLGRASTCDVIFSDTTISGQQAEIRSQGGVCYLVHLGFNPTRLNGEEIQGGVQLFDGDIVELPAGNALMFVEEATIGREAENVALDSRRHLLAETGGMVFGAQAGIPWGLRMVRGPWAAQPGQVIAFFDRAITRIGRAHDNDLVLEDPTVSRKQLVVMAVDGKLVARGQGRSPCLIDGAVLQENQQLTDGARITLSAGIELQVVLGVARPRESETAPASRPKEKKGGDLWLYGGMSSIITTLFILLLVFAPDNPSRRRAAMESMPEDEVASLVVESFGDQFFEPNADEAAVTESGRLRFSERERWGLRGRRSPKPLQERTPESAGDILEQARHVLGSSGVEARAYRDGFGLYFKAVARSPRTDRPALMRELDSAAKPYIARLARLLFLAKLQTKEGDTALAIRTYKSIQTLISAELNPGYRLVSDLILGLRTKS